MLSVVSRGHLCLSLFRLIMWLLMSGFTELWLIRAKICDQHLSVESSIRSGSLSSPNSFLMRALLHWTRHWSGCHLQCHIYFEELGPNRENCSLCWGTLTEQALCCLEEYSKRHFIISFWRGTLPTIFVATKLGVFNETSNNFQLCLWGQKHHIYQQLTAQRALTFHI